MSVNIRFNGFGSLHPSEAIGFAYSKTGFTDGRNLYSSLRHLTAME
jgi:hypothetical protein